MGTKPQLSSALSAERAKELVAELSELLRQQVEALEDATFISMNEEKAKAYEQRSKRIADLNTMLGSRQSA